MISEWDSFDQTPGISNYSKGFVFKNNSKKRNLELIT